MSSSASELLDRVRASGVVSAEQLDEFLASPDVSTNDSPKVILSKLVAAGLVTTFQAGLLRAGKYKGFRLGSYVILDKLGAGGMGQVFRARHATLPKEVAIKVLPPSFKADPVALARFVREARTCAAISHPNIVGVYDVLPDADPPHILMEYVPGLSLQQAVTQRGVFAPGEAADVGVQACTGLQRACEVGLVHRDIKPPNLLLTRAGQVKILDFGIARIKSDDDGGLTMQGKEKAILGTADYLAPEQAVDSSGVDSRADIYAMGATLYFLLAGHPPFPEKSTTAKLLKKQVTDPRPIQLLRPDVPVGLSGTIQQMLSRDPNQRPQTPAAAADLLRHFAHLGPDYPARLFGDEPSKRVPGSSLVTPTDRIPVPADAQANPISASAFGSGMFAVPMLSPGSGQSGISTPHSGAYPVPPASGAYVPSGPGSSFFAYPEAVVANGDAAWAAAAGYDPSLVGAGSQIAPGDVRPPSSHDGSGRIDFRTSGLPGTVVDTGGAAPTLIDQGANEDTSPETQSVSPSSRPQRVPRSDNTGRWIAIGAVTFAVLVVGGLVLAFSGSLARPEPTGPLDQTSDTQPTRTVHPRVQTLIVSKTLKNATRTIREALEKAKPGTRLEIKDESWEEAIDVNPSWFNTPDVTISGATPNGRRVVWRPAGDVPTDKPWLSFRDGSGLRIENFDFEGVSADGKVKLKWGPFLSGNYISISDCTFKKFAESELVLSQTRSGAAPVVVERCRFLQSDWPEANPELGPCGIQLGGHNNSCEDSIIRDCRFEGRFAAAIRIHMCMRTTIELNRFLGARNGIYYSGLMPFAQCVINRNMFSGVETGLRFRMQPAIWDKRPLRIQGNVFDQTKLVSAIEHPAANLRDWWPIVLWDRPVNPKSGLPVGDVRQFRKTFELPEGPVPEACLDVNCGQYRVWVNGKPLTPNWVSPGPMIDTLDLTSKLVPGKNVVAVEAKSDNHSKGGLQAAVRLIGKPAIDLPSAAGWKVSADSPPDWTSLTFDDSKWANATQIQNDSKPYRPGLVRAGVSTPAPGVFEIGGFPNIVGDDKVRDGNPSLKPKVHSLNLQRDPNQDDRVFLRIDPIELPGDWRNKVGVVRQ